MYVRFRDPQSNQLWQGTDEPLQCLEVPMHNSNGRFLYIRKGSHDSARIATSSRTLLLDASTKCLTVGTRANMSRNGGRQSGVRRGGNTQGC
ncbi:hypothetical protein FA13DRAFT_1745481 [Coprinellus micaceus]|uniref:Uncharacterized protein n=1 Tax=Coprinellus micaceus TaxID=71717 RepID=A0A4Y7SB23_COPMI|nr:hypothetical protein FA13DRAFT_1745481 [Coprinellus micaceus]